MKSIVNINERENELEIEIKPYAKTITIFGVTFTGLIFLIVGFITFYPVVHGIINNTVDITNVLFMVFIIGIGIVAILFGLNYLRKYFEKEIIKVSGDEIKLIKKFVIHKSEKIINRSDFLGIREAPTENFTKHHLDKGKFGELTFQKTEKEVQFLTKQGNLLLETTNKNYRFGKNIYFEQVDKIIDAIKNYA